VRKLNYVLGCLRRWKVDGYQAGGKQGRHTPPPKDHGKRASQPDTGGFVPKTKMQIIRERNDAVIQRVLEKIENGNAA